MGVELRRGQMSAWLLKKKSGSSVVRVRQYNKRYFTIDFDARVLSYSHTESSKKATTTIPFADMVDVRLPESHVDRSDNASECSRQSRTSWMKRLGGAGPKAGEEEHCVALVTKPARVMELMCPSAAEAMQWFEAFRAAIADKGDEDVVNAEMACGDSPSSCEGAVGKAFPRASALEEDVDASAALAGGNNALDREAAAVPRSAKGTFLDLNTEPEEAHVAGRPVRVEDAAIVRLTPEKLEASAFGFDAEEDGDSSAASSLPATPLGIGALDLASAAAAGGDSRATTGRRSYADQHEGLSVKERLANLEFSDAEDDDDDDPLGLGKAKAN
mmetsp:Transcript_35597/g.82670  ORF Transcript_35597/g.82670 Transcript_35597/m.82670 type:complete len:330 (-) Transcript_35597:44-1033(-)